MAKSVTSSRSKSRAGRKHKPLSEDVSNTGPLRQSKKRKLQSNAEDEENFVDTKSSRKILKIGQELVQEEERGRQSQAKPSNLTFELRRNLNDESEEEVQPDDGDDAWGDEEEEVEIEASPEDLDLFNKFLPPEVDPVLKGPILGSQSSPPPASTEDSQTTNLADLILAKIAAHEASRGDNGGERGLEVPEDAIEIPAKVVEVYSKVGILLSRYKSGKLPKPFKIIPTIPYWEDLLAMTRPASWTPNACYEAARIFSSAKPDQCQRFLESVILDRVREDIHETKKLNVHLYKALKKSLYRPAAFFKGILFPLIGSGTCTLREAHIISSVLVRVSVPVLHSAAALLKLCELAAEQASMSTEGGGATNIFIRVLLDKKYALPYKVIDALVFHFLRFRATDPLSANGTAGAENAMLGVTSQDSREAKDTKLPVLWHQSLLAFAQRYRNDITEDQREALLDLLLVRGHSKIGPEVRRELLEGRERGAPLPAADVADDGDDTMLVDSAT